MIANFLNQLVQVATLAEPILGVAAGAAEGAEIGAILGPLGVIAGVAIGGGIALATMHLAENYHRHDIECKSKKDARDKAQKYGGGVPPEGPHNDSFGSHYHPRRQRHDEFEKITTVRIIGKNDSKNQSIIADDKPQLPLTFLEKCHTKEIFRKNRI